MCSLRIPTPWSETSNLTADWSMRALRVIWVPGSEYFMALVSRFTRIWCSLRASPITAGRFSGVLQVRARPLSIGRTSSQTCSTTERTSTRDQATERPVRRAEIDPGLGTHLQDVGGGPAHRVPPCPSGQALGHRIQRQDGRLAVDNDQGLGELLKGLVGERSLPRHVTGV